MNTILWILWYILCFIYGAYIGHLFSIYAKINVKNIILMICAAGIPPFIGAIALINYLQ